MSKMNEWLPISIVSEKVNIPPETVRRYARRYGEFLDLERGEKNAYLIHEDSLETITQIRYLLEQGHPHGQVKKLLNKQAETTSDDGEDDEIQQLQIEILEEIKDLQEQHNELMESLQLIHERMDRYEEYLFAKEASKYEQMEEQDKEQRDYERKRDEYLMKTMNESQENRRGNTEIKGRDGLFIKLFKK